jgi:hypothetical protein
MLTIVLPEQLENAITAAAQRSGLSINEYMTAVCTDALSLEIDRARVDSYLEGTPAISHERAMAWLTDLANGKRTECPR